MFKKSTELCGNKIFCPYFELGKLYSSQGRIEEAKLAYNKIYDMVYKKYQDAEAQILHIKKHNKDNLYKSKHSVFNVDIMDAEGNDLELDIQNGKVIKKNYVGRHIQNYDSMLVLSHFKGHPMGGYGGALKQLSIGVASSRGKVYIHTAGKTTDANKLWDNLPEQDKFIEAMADAASVVHNKFKGNIAYINVMKNMSVDCDCCAVAEDPCMKDIGVLASLDPVAIDKACIDLVYNSTDPGRDHLVERIETRHGTHILEASNKLNFGTTNYELINIDK